LTKDSGDEFARHHSERHTVGRREVGMIIHPRAECVPRHLPAREELPRLQRKPRAQDLRTFALRHFLALVLLRHAHAWRLASRFGVTDTGIPCRELRHQSSPNIFIFIIFFY